MHSLPYAATVLRGLSIGERMARPQKQIVDYFPHSCVQGKTLFTIQKLFGNDGYSTVFKLLELLGQSEGHFFNARDVDSIEYLWAYLDLEGDRGTEIIDKLARLQFIDTELWTERVLWCQNLVDNLDDVYSRRVVMCPQKPPIDIIMRQESRLNGVSDDINPQSKVNESKEE